MPKLLRRTGYTLASWFYWSYSSYLSTRATSTKGVMLGRSRSIWNPGSRHYRQKWVEEGSVSESSTQAQVALTFDDGPTPGVTNKVLEILKRYQAQATFFLIGRKINLGRELILQAIQEGHRVGNHTYHHRWIPSLGKYELLEEVRTTQDALREITSKPGRWFRPPYGALRNGQEKYIVGEGLQLAYWSVNSKDWRHPGVQAITQKVIREIHPGAVVVLHDVHEQTVQALPFILDHIKQRGWRAVTLSEMFPRPQAKSVTP